MTGMCLIETGKRNIAEVNPHCDYWEVNISKVDSKVLDNRTEEELM